MGLMEAKEKREKRASLIASQHAMFARAKQENRETLNSEEFEQYDRQEIEIQKLGQEVETLDRLNRLESLSASIKQAEYVPASNAEWKSYKNSPPPSDREKSLAFRAFASAGTPFFKQEWGNAALKLGLDPNQRIWNLNTYGTATQTTGTGSLGGYLVQTDLMKSVIEAMKQFGTLRNKATVLKTEHGNNFDVPLNNDTANVAVIVGQNSGPATLEIDFSKKTLGAFKYQTVVVVTREMLQDTGFDIPSYVGTILGRRMARGTEADYAVGVGTTAPQGIVVGSTQAVATASASAVTYDEIIEAIYSIDAAYRQSPSFGIMCHDSFASLMRQQISSTGQPIWSTGIEAGQPDRYAGVPVWTNNSLATVATNSKSAVVGDLSQYFIRDAQEFELFRNDYALQLSNDSVAFTGTMRTDGQCLFPTSAAPVKYIQMSPGT